MAANHERLKCVLNILFRTENSGTSAITGEGAPIMRGGGANLIF